MKANQKNQIENFKGDMLFHLQSVKIAIESLQLNCNRDKYIYSLCDKALERIAIIEKLLSNSKLTLPISIAIQVNSLFKEDKNLSIVNVHLVNSKRLYNPTGIAILKLKL
jgi:hypothetical protein